MAANLLRLLSQPWYTGSAMGIVYITTVVPMPCLQIILYTAPAMPARLDRWQWHWQIKWAYNFWIIKSHGADIATKSPSQPSFLQHSTSVSMPSPWLAYQSTYSIGATIRDNGQQRIYATGMAPGVIHQRNHLVAYLMVVETTIVVRSGNWNWSPIITFVDCKTCWQYSVSHNNSIVHLQCIHKRGWCRRDCSAHPC